MSPLSKNARLFRALREIVGPARKFWGRNKTPPPKSHDEKLKQALDQLNPESYQVYHRVPCSEGIIDHLIFARSGAFIAISEQAPTGMITQNSGLLLLDGKPLGSDPLHQVLSWVFALRTELRPQVQQDIWITGVICFTHAFVQVPEPVQGVHVVFTRSMAKLLVTCKPNTSLAPWLWEHASTFTQGIPPSNHPTDTP
jgi:hypothetical protein